MKHSIWKLFIITAMAMILGVAPAVNADDEYEWEEVSGMVAEIYPDINMIVINSNEKGFITITCFPFNKLEAELDEVLDPLEPDAEGIKIDVNDCVIVKFSQKTLLYSGEIVNKFESLTSYCEDCLNDCYEGDLNNEPMSKRYRTKPGYGDGQGHGQGKGQGHINGKPPVTVPGHNKR